MLPTIRQETAFNQRLQHSLPDFEGFCTLSLPYPVPPAAGDSVFTENNLSNLQLGECTGLDGNDIRVKIVQQTFFRRSCLNNAWAFINARDTVSLVGLPGNGKSVCVLRYAFWADTPAAPRRFAYVRGVGNIVFVVWYHHRLMRYEYYRAIVTDTKSVLSFVKILLQESAKALPLVRINTMIVDGFSPEIHNAVHSFMTVYPQIKYIRAVSWQSQRPNANVQNTRPIADFVFPGWNVSDYTMAIQQNCFPSIIVPGGLTPFENQLTIANLIKERMYYVGGNARYFSAAGINWERFIVAEINKAIDSVSNLTDLTLGEIQQGALSAVNTLFSVNSHGQSVFVSEYAAKQVSRKTTAGFIAAARARMSTNPSFQGWITELEALMKMQTQLRMNLYDGTGTVVESWDRNSEHESVWFFDATEPQISAANLHPRVYYFPQKWNQGTFDGIYLASRHTAHFFNVTDARKHSLKIHLLKPFIRAMQVHRVIFYFIGRNSNVPNFAAPVLRPLARFGLRSLLSSIRRAKMNNNANPLGAADPENATVFQIRVVSYEP